MAIVYPLDILAGFPGWSTEFNLQFRQEFSRTAGGLTIAKDMGTPLWRATYQSRSMQPNELDEWRARFSVLEGSVQRFMGQSISRCYPIAHPDGQGLGSVSDVKVDTKGENNKSVTFSGLPSGYRASVGDYVQIGQHLYQIVGVDSAIEVRPHLAPSTAVGNAVVLVRPSVPMIIVPGTLTTTAELATGRGVVTFQAVESR